MAPARKPTALLKQLRSELPRLLRDDVEVRGQVIAILSEYLTTREETAAILAEIRELGRRIDEQARHMIVLEERMLSLEQRMGSLERTTGAIGARWGMMSEDAFRQGVRALFAEQPEVRAEPWRCRDEAGRVFGHPADIELDAVVRNGIHVLVEIKSSVSAGDVFSFARKAEFYEEITGQHPHRRVMISPFVDDRARETARQLGIEVHAATTPPRV